MSASGRVFTPPFATLNDVRVESVIKSTADITSRSLGAREGPAKILRLPFSVETPSQSGTDRIALARNSKRWTRPFCAAMLRATDAGEERAPEAICGEPGTRNPIFVLAN